MVVAWAEVMVGRRGGSEGPYYGTVGERSREVWEVTLISILVGGP